MQKPIYSSEEEMALMGKLWNPQIADNPELFVMFAFPWGQKNTPLEKYSGPREWQRKQLRNIAEHIKKNKDSLSPDILREAVSSGRGIGKSALVSWLILWMITTRIGSSIIVSANSEAQLRTVTWGELTKWVIMCIHSHWWEISATKLMPAQWITELVERDLKKGTRYWAAEGKLWSEENPDAYAGAHNHDGMMVIFDEASGIPDSIWSVTSGFFTEKILDRYWLAFSNPRRSSGYFFECFNSKREFWKTSNIDARTVEGTDVKIYEEIISEYGADSAEAYIEVYGEFPLQEGDQFIGISLVDEAMKRPPYKDPDAPVIIGIDPARGGDNTVIVVRKGRDLVTIKRYKGDDTMVVVGQIIDAIEEYRPTLTVIDEGGLGYGILDRLNELRYNVKGVNFGWKSKKPIMWGNKRAEMWGMMKEWLKTASLIKDKQLKIDLISPHRKPNSTGTIFLESKDSMRARGVASPDAADALAVTFAYPVASKGMYNNIKVNKNNYPVSGLTNWMGA